MRQKNFAQSRDDFTNYRELCEARLKRLERYKKTKSFCSLESNEASTSSVTWPSANQSSIAETSLDRDKSLVEYPLPPHKTPYDLLREKMISLMETDTQLLNQLLTLGDTINELREKQPLQRSASEVSLSSSNCDDENDDELRPMAECQNTFSVSMSAITHLYVHDGGESEIDELENLPSVQYFSRKNSVLRIPIPARASNRILGKKIPRRPSELLRPRLNKTAAQIATKQELSENQQLLNEKLYRPLEVDEARTYESDSSPVLSQHSPDNQSTMSSCCENERKATLSAASIDSGIRDDESSSPVNELSAETDSKQTVDV